MMSALSQFPNLLGRPAKTIGLAVIVWFALFGFGFTLAADPPAGTPAGVAADLSDRLASAAPGPVDECVGHGIGKCCASLAGCVFCMLPAEGAAAIAGLKALTAPSSRERSRGLTALPYTRPPKFSA